MMILRWILLALTLEVLVVPPVIGQQSPRNNTRYSYTASDTVFVFVHGIFSNSEDCWTSPSRKYWPEILDQDPRFDKPNIFLGGYYTDASSGLYGIRNAADELLSHLRVRDPKGIPAPLTPPRIVFIAHSTGGLVVRYLIERNQELLIFA